MNGPKGGKHYYDKVPQAFAKKGLKQNKSKLHLPMHLVDTRFND